MKIYHLSNFIKGWFIGNFEPTVFKTEQFEVALHTHKKGEKPQSHYHKISTEITVVINGMLKINDVIMDKGSIFILEPNEISKAEILKDCNLIVVKFPSVKDDKYNV